MTRKLRAKNAVKMTLSDLHILLASKIDTELTQNC